MRAVAAGAIAGAVILGIIGRLATVGVAIVTGFPLNLTARGWFEVAVAGAAVGAVGGVLLNAMRSRLQPPKRGVIVGAVLFGAMAVASWAGGRIGAGAPAVTWITLAVVAVVFVVYGLGADVLLDRFEKRDGMDAGS